MFSSRVLLAATALIAFSACSTMGPDEAGTPRDAASQVLSRLAAEEAAYGGVGFDDGEFLVYTLGEDAEAAARIREAFRGVEDGIEVRPRPARTTVTDAYVERVVRAVGGEPHGVAVDPTSGYLRVGVSTVLSARVVVDALGRAAVPLDDVLVAVEDRPTPP